MQLVQRREDEEGSLEILKEDWGAGKKKNQTPRIKTL